MPGDGKGTAPHRPDAGRAPVRLRAAVPGDELAVAAVHVASWRDAYRDLMPAEFLVALDPADRARRYTFDAPGRNAPATVLAVDDEDAIWGFATVGPSRDADTEGLGELYALYVDPPRLGTGTGRLLLADARARLAARGHPAAILWVLIGNAPARRFYARDGWERDGAERVEQPYGIVSTVVRYRCPLP
jgi:GNAT superfamily N-acetyltransferase